MYSQVVICRVAGERVGAGPRRRARIRSRSACPAIRSARTPRTRSARCSTASTAASPARSRATATPTRTRIPASPGTRRSSRNTSQDPRAKIPGTKMVFAGIKSENERTNLWAYLKQFDADGQEEVDAAALTCVNTPVAPWPRDWHSGRPDSAPEPNRSRHDQGSRRQPVGRAAATSPAPTRSRSPRRSARMSPASRSATSRSFRRPSWAAFRPRSSRQQRDENDKAANDAVATFDEAARRAGVSFESRALEREPRRRGGPLRRDRAPLRPRGGRPGRARQGRARGTDRRRRAVLLRPAGAGRALYPEGAAQARPRDGVLGREPQRGTRGRRRDAVARRAPRRSTW